MVNLYRTSSAQRHLQDWCAERLASWRVPHGRAVLPTSLGPTHLVEVGEGEPVCVFLPGTSFNAATSTRLLERLAARGTVVCPDLPGQPGLSAPERPRRDTAYGVWLAEVLDHVRAAHPGRPLVVAGHSRGAAVALSGPTDVDALVLLSPAGLVGVRVGAAAVRASVPWLLRPTESRSRRLLTLMSGPGTAPEPTLVDWMTLVARETRTTGAPGPLPDDVVSRWRGRTVRVLVGEHDCFFPASRVTRAARERLGVEAEVLAGLGHLVVDEAPQLVAERVVLRQPGSP